MTKITHIATGISAGLIADLGGLETGALVAGCLFPDIVERITPAPLKHRGMSHWGVAYGLLAIMIYLNHSMLPQFFTAVGITPLMAVYFLAGCTLHWVADALTPMGVPVVPGWRLQGPIKTGGAAERALLVLALLVIFLIWQSRYEPSMESIESIFMTGIT